MDVSACVCARDRACVLIRVGACAVDFTTRLLTLSASKTSSTSTLTPD